MSLLESREFGRAIIVITVTVTLATLSPSVDAALHHLAYGVKKEYQFMAETRILHYKEKMALECSSGENSNATWYRRALKIDSAMLGEEEIVYPTLLMDHDMVGKRLKKRMVEQKPHQFKFEMRDSLNGSELIIHDADWHDLGQYYCTDGTDVFNLYLVYYRPVVLYFENEERLKANKLDSASVEGISGNTFLTRIEDNDLDEFEYPIHVRKEGTICAMWRAYPFVDSVSSAFPGLQHSGMVWDDGDIVKVFKKKDPHKKEVHSFRGEVGVDIEEIKDSRYKYEMDLVAGTFKLRITDAKMEDKNNLTLLTFSERGPTWTFIWVRIDDPRHYILPLFIVCVEVFVVLSVSVAAFLVDRRGRRKRGDSNVNKKRKAGKSKKSKSNPKILTDGDNHVEPVPMVPIASRNDFLSVSQRASLEVEPSKTTRLDVSFQDPKYAASQRSNVATVQ